MASLTVRKEVALDVPKLLVAVAQPYQTLSGPALTTHFLYQPQLLPFQAGPFAHAAVPPLYFYTLLHTLAEFAETPRPVRASHTKMLQPPKADFWRAVGTLNCFYGTVYDNALRGDAAHPAMGAVELVQPSHRSEKDVRLTLFDEAHQPMAALRMTGPRETTKHSAAIATTAGSSAPTSLRRTPLPYVPPPSFSGHHSERGYKCFSTQHNREAGSPSTLYAATTSSLSPVCSTSGKLNAFGGLYGDLVSLSDGGYAHRACFGSPLLGGSLHVPSAVSHTPHASTTTTTTSDDRSGEGEQEEAEVCVPPWLLYECVTDFCAELFKEGRLGVDVKDVTDVLQSSPSSEGDGVSWRLAAHQSVQCGDAVFSAPLDVVCGPPKVDLHYRVPPWRQELGLPALSLAQSDFPCVRLCAEVRQEGQVVMCGAFFFVPLLV